MQNTAFTPQRQRAILSTLQLRIRLIEHRGRSLLLAGGSTLEQRWALAGLIGQLVLGKPIRLPHELMQPAIRKALEGNHPDVDVLDGDPFLPDLKRVLSVDVDAIDPILTLVLLSLMWQRVKSTDEALLRTHLKIKGTKVDADAPLYEFQSAITGALDELYDIGDDAAWARPPAQWVKSAQALVQTLGEIERARKSTVLKLDWIRDWNTAVRRPPNQADFRLSALLGANRFNQSSANALLRTIEEPPASTAVVLGAWHPASLLSTIRSRCLAIDLGQPVIPIDDTELRAAHRFLSGHFVEPLGTKRSQADWIQSFDSSRRRPGEPVALTGEAMVHITYRWLHEALNQRYGLTVNPEFADHPLLHLLAQQSLAELYRLQRFLDSCLAALSRNVSPDLVGLSIVFTLAALADPEGGHGAKKEAMKQSSLS